MWYTDSNFIGHRSTPQTELHQPPQDTLKIYDVTVVEVRGVILRDEGHSFDPAETITSCVDNSSFQMPQTSRYC